MTRLRIGWLWLCASAVLSLQGQDFSTWFQKQIDDLVAKQVAADQVGQNGKGTDRQRQSPSADPRSTSLVDQSSVTDFISVAASLLPVPSSATGAASAS